MTVGQLMSARENELLVLDRTVDQPVDLLMLLLAPMGAGADHLKALARVARILTRADVVKVSVADIDWIAELAEIDLDGDPVRVLV